MSILTFSEDNLKSLLSNFQTDLVSFFRQEAENIVNSLLQNEIEDFFLEAIEDTKGDVRNGYYTRTILTELGPLSLRIPRDRFDLFKTQLLKPYQRRLESVDDMIQTLYFKGMSENEIVDQISYQMDGKISRETIRKTINKTLGKANEFNSKTVPDCSIVYLDGTYIPVKRGDKVEKECVMVALGIKRDGKRAILGFSFTPNEGALAWKEMLLNLKERGLINPALFVTDGLNGMPNAIKEVYPEAELQTCLIHVLRNLTNDFRKRDRKEISNDFKAIWNSNTEEEAKEALNNIVVKWSKTYPSTMRKLLEKENLFTFFHYPKEIRKSLYSTNPIESFNSLLKRQTRKRVLMNSESNAILIISEVCESYNKRTRQIRNLTEMEEIERDRYFEDSIS